MDSSSLVELMERMAQLGRECPWTREQSPATALVYLQEECAEAQEVLQNNGSGAELTSELGDILFNLLLALERSNGSVTLEAVAASSLQKLRRRYAPLFDGTLTDLSVEAANRVWLDGKAADTQRIADTTATNAKEGPDAKEQEEEEEEEWDEALAAEIAELERQEARDKEMAERELLARLVMEEISQQDDDPTTTR